MAMGGNTYDQKLTAIIFLGEVVKIARRYTVAGQDAYSDIAFRTINLEAYGQTAAPLRATVPASWSAVATNILVRNYCCKEGVPALCKAVAEDRVPTWLWRSEADEGELSNLPEAERFGGEDDARQVFDRLAGTWTYWGWKAGYFDTEQDAEAFFDEMRCMLAKQVAAPSPAQWLGTGLHWAYGINQPASGNYYVDYQTGQLNSSTSAFEHPQPFVWPTTSTIEAEQADAAQLLRALQHDELAEGLSGLRHETCQHHLNTVMAAAAVSTEIAENPALRSAIQQARQAGLSDNLVQRALELAQQGITTFDLPPAGHAEAERQSFKTIRLSNAFMQSLSSSKPDTQEQLKQLAQTIWQCGEPAAEFTTTTTEWQTTPDAYETAPEGLGLNQATLNLAHFRLANGRFDLDSAAHAARLWTVALEISVLMAEFPSAHYADLAYQYRAIGLGYANLGAYLMASGLAYDSKEGRATAAAITALITAMVYSTSSEMAEELGAFPAYVRNAEAMLRIIQNHGRAGYGKADGYDALSAHPVPLQADDCPDADLAAAARLAWDRVVEQGHRHGFRNAQATTLADPGNVVLLLDCDTTGLDPDFALVKFKPLANGTYAKIINRHVPPALASLGYEQAEIQDMVDYAVGKATLMNAPGIDHAALIAKGFTENALVRIERQLISAFDLGPAFNRWTLGEDFCTNALGIPTALLHDPELNILEWLGFSEADITAATLYCCGALTLEGAPHLKPEHLAVFDCAKPCGLSGKRALSITSHLQMMAAVQPFLSGAIEKTISLPSSASINHCRTLIEEAWAQGLKTISLYRDGSKLSQPLAHTLFDDMADEPEAEVKAEPEILAEPVIEAAIEPAAPHRVAEEVAPPEPAIISRKIAPVIEQKISSALRTPLPRRSRGFTQKATIAGYNLRLHTSEYADGRLGEVFIELQQPNPPLEALLASYSAALSLGLQYGVPLVDYLETHNASQLEQAKTENSPLQTAASILSYVMKELAASYLADKNDSAETAVEAAIASLQLSEEQPQYQADFGASGLGSAMPAPSLSMPGEPSTTSAPPTADLAEAAPPSKETIASTLAVAQLERIMERVREARAKGYEGQVCTDCGSMTLRQSANSLKCDTCGSTTSRK